MKNNDELYPLATSVKAGCRIINCGTTKMFELIKTGEIESYKDGKTRQLVVASLHDYVARRRAEAAIATESEPPAKATSRVRRASDLDGGEAA
jgi:hypothetical protein